MGQPGTASLAFIGLVLAVFILVALTAVFVVQLQAAWARIAVRGAGSWIVASRLLMLGSICEESYYKPQFMITILLV